MTTTDIYPPASRRDGPYDRPTWFGQAVGGLRRAVGWLDDKGRPAWFATTVAGLFIAPPVGVALLLFMLGTGRMFSSRHHDRHAERHERRSMGCGMRRDRMDSWRQAREAMRPSGNATFDAYKADTLRRLEEEQQSFEAFLGRLREAKDKAEFDQFMEDRARKADQGDDGESEAA